MSGITNFLRLLRCSLRMIVKLNDTLEDLRTTTGLVGRTKTRPFASSIKELCHPRDWTGKASARAGKLHINNTIEMCRHMPASKSFSKI
jgi:hypothetical protein